MLDSVLDGAAQSMHAGEVIGAQLAHALQLRAGALHQALSVEAQSHRAAGFTHLLERYQNRNTLFFSPCRWFRPPARTAAARGGRGPNQL